MRWYYYYYMYYRGCLEKFPCIKAPGDQVHFMQFFASNLVPRSLTVTFFKHPVELGHQNHHLFNIYYIFVSLGKALDLKSFSHVSYAIEYSLNWIILIWPNMGWIFLRKMRRNVRSWIEGTALEIKPHIQQALEQPLYYSWGTEVHWLNPLPSPFVWRNSDVDVATPEVKYRSEFMTSPVKLT
jgi:hypothetical protein